MTRWLLLVAYGLNVGLMSGAAWAQQPNRVPVVGLLMSSVALHDPVLEALRAGLKEQGYVEGQNIRLEYRGAQGNLDLLPSLAEELVRLKVDAIVVGNERSARVAKEATASIPIVVSLYNYDPVAGGLIDSFPTRRQSHRTLYPHFRVGGQTPRAAQGDGSESIAPRGLLGLSGSGRA